MVENIVTLKDAQGNTYKLKRTVYNGETFNVFGLFKTPDILLPALKEYQPRTDDIWLLTYQKAGTHWVYEIIGILLSGTLDPMPHTKGKDFLEICPEALAKDEKRILNTHLHDRFLPKVAFEKCKAVIVVRNPKSVAVSSYYFFKGMESTAYSGTFSGYLQSFVEGGAFGEYTETWYSYYCTFWKKYKENPNVLFVFYEDLKKNPVDSIMDIAKFLGLDRDRKFCEGVAELTSFSNMKNKVGKTTPSAVPITIQRKGIIDDWKNEFTVAENEAFDEDYKEKMKDFQELANRIQFS